MWFSLTGMLVVEANTTLQGAEEGRRIGAGALGVGERGGAGSYPQGGSGDPGDSAGTGEQDGGGDTLGDPTDVGVAAGATGAVGDSGRSLEAAARQVAISSGRGEPLEAGAEDLLDGEGAREPTVIHLARSIGRRTARAQSRRVRNLLLHYGKIARTFLQHFRRAFLSQTENTRNCNLNTQ